MSQVAAVPVPVTGLAPAAADAARAEHRWRLGASLLLVLFLFLANLGLQWDIRWHGAVGRDSFWTAPHLLLYSGVALAGLLCLAVVLATTVRYHRGDPALDDENTIVVFGVFRGPLGFVIAGFGMLTLLAAAPLDDYWHRLYGIDVALWAPFHLMGLVGGGIAGLGTIYALAAEAARARTRGWVRWRLAGFSGLELWTLFAAAGLLTGMLTLAQPAAWEFPTFDVGPVRLVLSYPLLLAVPVVLLAVAVVRLTRRPGAAIVMVGLYVLRQLATGAFVPWAIHVAVAQQGLAYRSPAAEPRFSVFNLTVAAAFFVPAVLIDLAAWGGSRDLACPRVAALAGALAALPLFALGAWLVAYSMTHARALGAPPELLVPALPPASAVWLALPLTLLLGAAAGALGSGLGANLRLNER
ncbi:MAG TPA: hypothetical protein VII06_42000 [Chloroflexota bacterium]|jgi:hypothetical protein